MKFKENTVTKDKNTTRGTTNISLLVNILRLLVTYLDVYLFLDLNIKSVNFIIELIFV